MRRWAKSLLRRVGQHLPPQDNLSTLKAEHNALLATVKQLRSNLAAYERGWPPGHFYSPIPDLNEIAHDEERIFGPLPSTIPGIDLNVPEQLEILAQLRMYCSSHYH